VALLRSADPVLVTYVRTDNNGNFTLQKLSPGSFLVMIARPAVLNWVRALPWKTC
jgi:hypothetical protein